VNSLLFQAAKDRASDIHIEPYERDLKVRFRIDGILYDIISPPKRFQPVIISRVKIMAGLNIAEKRLPQDGRIRIRLAGKDIDIRVSSVPTAFGERVVMRLLDKATTVLHLEELGLTGNKHEVVSRLIRQSHGIVLVTGPTGSGKTTTLYACLSKINTVDKNIITIEDPIEYQLHGIGQIQVNPKIELTFASGLRSILRQDPDVIMVGEIRDLETAEIAIQAALTGHLVFSTHGDRTFPRFLLCHRGDGTAPGSARLPRLPRSVPTDARGTRGTWRVAAASHGPNAVQGKCRLRPVQEHRVPGPHRNSRTPGRRR
jgi:general secretion pathway protein E